VTVLCDREIRQLALEQGMIEPFVNQKVRQTGTSNGQMRRVISYGLSSYGYDFRMAADDVRVFVAKPHTVIDPHDFDATLLEKVQPITDLYDRVYVELPPHSFALGRTVEYWRIPIDVITVCVGKSTMARCGLVLNVTPFESGWSGYATLEISNTTPLTARVYLNEGIGQVLFFRGEACERPYGNGTYQDQGAHVVLPFGR
jgi:dCTP deaminase